MLNKLTLEVTSGAQTKLSLVILFLLQNFLFNSVAHAEQRRTPNDVYAGIAYASRIADKLLAERKINDITIPLSRETDVKPMHVYELHTTVLSSLYEFSLTLHVRPPPVAVSTPILYTPEDVYKLTSLVVNNLEKVYKESGRKINFRPIKVTGKTPSDVFQVLYTLYYQVHLLNSNGKKLSPNNVYAQIQRAREDLQYCILTISKRLEQTQEEQKRMLVSSVYGFHPNGSTMPPIQQDKTPKDVLYQALDTRENINRLRQYYNMERIKVPQAKQFTQVAPVDVFLQTQIIIAELNLLKIPMGISSTTNRPVSVTDKSPSDVFHETKHIDYMINRLLKVDLRGKGVSQL